MALAGGAARALGIDIEPATPLPDDLLGFALGAEERRMCASAPVRTRLVFAAKEAVYKAVQPLDGSKPEYGDIALAPDFASAGLADGRRLQLAWIEAPMIVAAAWLPVPAP